LSQNARRVVFGTTISLSCIFVIFLSYMRTNKNRAHPSVPFMETKTITVHVVQIYTATKERLL
jgi:hypothetical protein